MLAKALQQRAIDLLERRHASEQLAQGHDALARVFQVAPRELLHRDAQHVDHARGIEVDEQRPLEKKRRAVGDATRAAELSAVDFDVVAGTELSGDTEALQPRGGGAANARRSRCEIRAQGAAREHELPADLAFVQVQSAAARDAAADLDALARAVLQPHLVREHLV